VNNRNQKLSPEEIKAKMVNLSKGREMNESTETKSKELLYYKSAADGQIYGIVKENSKYYVKVAGKKENTDYNITDFRYIGSPNNRLDERYDSYASARKRIDGKLQLLNENYKRLVKEEEIPLNKDIDKEKPEGEDGDSTEAPETKEIEKQEEPAEKSDDLTVDEPTDDTINIEEPADTDTSDEKETEEPADDKEDGDSDKGGDTDLKDEVASLLGKLSQTLGKMGDVDAPLAKNALNTVISATKSGIEKMDDSDKEKLQKRIEKDGEKLDEKLETGTGYVIMGKLKNGDKEPLDSAETEQEAKELTKEYKKAHGADWKIWYEIEKVKEPVEENQINEGEYDVKKYAVKVKHDKGTKVINVTATSEDSAKKMIMKAEGCPETAILSVKDLGNVIKDKKEKIKLIKEHIDKMVSKQVSEKEEKLIAETLEKINEEDLFDMVNELYDEDYSYGDTADYNLTEVKKKLEAIEEEANILANTYVSEKYGNNLDEIDLKPIYDKFKNIFNKKGVDKLLATDPKLKADVEDGIEASKDPEKYSTWKQKVGKSLGILLLILKLYGISSSAMAADTNKVSGQDVNQLKGKIEKVNHTEPDNHGDGEHHTDKNLSTVKTADGFSVDVQSKFASGQVDLDQDDKNEVKRYLHDNIVKYVNDITAKNPSAVITFTVDGSASHVTAPDGMTNQELADDRVHTLDNILAEVIKDATQKHEIKWDNVKLVAGNGVVGGPEYTQGQDDPHDQKFTDHQYAKVKASVSNAEYKPVKADINITVKDPNAGWNSERVAKLFDAMKSQNKIPKNLSMDDFVKNIKTGDIKIKNQVTGDMYNKAILAGLGK